MYHRKVEEGVVCALYSEAIQLLLFLLYLVTATSALAALAAAFAFSAAFSSFATAFATLAAASSATSSRRLRTLAQRVYQLIAQDASLMPRRAVLKRRAASLELNPQLLARVVAAAAAHAADADQINKRRQLQMVSTPSRRDDPPIRPAGWIEDEPPTL